MPSRSSKMKSSVFFFVAVLLATQVQSSLCEGLLWSGICYATGYGCDPPPDNVTNLILNISDIGSNWVQLTWGEAAGNAECPISNSTVMCTCDGCDTIITKETSSNVANTTITGLASSTNYTCTVNATPSATTCSLNASSPISFIPGNGTVIDVPNNHVIIARFTDELSDIVLNCTVENEDIQTDTVWKPDDIVVKSHIFGDGRRASSNMSDSIYGNHLNVSADLMKGLDEVNVTCGSHENSSQVIFEFHILTPPSEPQKFQVFKVVAEFIYFSWNEPSYRGSPDLAGYELSNNDYEYSDIKEESSEISVDDLIEGECYNFTVHAVNEGYNKSRKSLPSNSVWIAADRPHGLKFMDIGYDWVYLTWESLTLTCGPSQWQYNITCSNESASFSITTPDTAHNVTNLLFNTSYSCMVIAFQEGIASSLLHRSISFIPGAGTVTGVQDNHVVIARFSDELSDITLNCTVANEGIQTDTVWKPDDDIKSHIRGDGRRESSKSDSTYGNLLSISADLMRELDGVNVSCGSHTNPHQAIFEFHVQDVPWLSIDSDVHLWEGTTDCTVNNIIAGPLVKLKNIAWSKDKNNVKEGLQEIAFKEITKHDGGLYIVTFQASSHDSSDPRAFKFSFTLVVMYGPNMTEGPREYSVLVGNSVILICSESLDSHPEATVTWTSNKNEEISSGDERYIMSSGPNVTLKIKKATESDSGTWRCTIKNNGRAEVCPDPYESSRTKNIEMQLFIVVPPSEPRNFHVVEVIMSTIFISWEQPLKPGSPAFAGYELCYDPDCHRGIHGERAEISVSDLKQRECYNMTIRATNKKNNVSGKSIPSNTVWIARDSPGNLKSTDIGYDWVYLTWESLKLTCGLSQYNITCSNEWTSFSITTQDTAHNVTNLLSNAEYSCTVVAFQERIGSSLPHPSISFIPGVGTVIGVPDNHVIIANFTDELNDTTLNCTVEYEGIQTDTMWKPDDIVAKSHVFGDGRRASSNKSDPIYGNHLTISADLMRELDGMNVSCGSHANPHQAIFDFHIQDVPQLSIDSEIQLWEKATDCTIDNIISAGPLVNIKNIIWRRNEKSFKGGITNHGFPSLTFDEITKHDGGLYVVNFYASSHENSSLRHFEFSFKLGINYGPYMTEGPREYSVLIGNPVVLICGESLDSDPNATVTWTGPKSGEIHSDDERYIMSSGPNVTLTIKKATESDSGTWKCTVENNGVAKFCDKSISKRKLEVDILLDVVGATDDNGISLQMIVSVLVALFVPVPAVCCMCMGAPKIGQPGKPKASKIAHDNVELTWTPPKANAKKVTSYALLYRSIEDPPGQWNRKEAKQTTAKVEGLSPNITYTFKVCALCKESTGPESEITDPITTTSVHSKPYMALSTPHATHITHNSVTVAWDDEDSEVDDYTVQYRPLDSSNWKEFSVHTQSRSAIIGGLRPKTKYIFRICAVSGVTSSISEPVMTETDVESEVEREPTLAESLKERSLKISSGDAQPSVYYPRAKTAGDQITRCIVSASESELIDFTSPVNEKVLMLVGATGAGKSTLINGIVNYIMGVRWEDNFRFKVVVDEKDTSQAFSQTSKITAYSFCHSTLPYTLTVIDTPGFGDTRGMERDKSIVNQIRSFFSDHSPDSVKQIHGVGFVIQAACPRLTATMKYVFDSVLSIFGKDIASNIFLLITFSDGQTPPVLSAIKDAKIPYQKAFQFNNSALYAKQNNEIPVDKMFWKLGCMSFERFFTEFKKAEPHSLQLTRENLEERQHLEAVVEGLKLQIQVGMTKIDMLRQKQQILRRREADILRNEHFEYELTVTKQRLVDLPENESVTNCTQCNFTCHYPCPIAEDKEKYRCKAMDSGGKESAHCTVCPGNCPWSQHVNASQRFELYYVVETHTSDELKKNLSDAIQGKNEIEAIISDIEKELEMLQGVIVGMVREAKRSLERLQEVALKPNPLSETEYIDLLIKDEKSEKKPGFIERVKAFEIVKTMVKEHDSKGGRKLDSSWWKAVLDRK